MGRSEKTEEALRLLWLQFDRAEIERGQGILQAAADEGDADATAYLAMTYLGGDYTWRGCGLTPDAGRGAHLLREAVKLGSAQAVLIALRRGVLTPGVRRAMAFPTPQGAWDAVLQAARDHYLPQYLVGDGCYYGDPLRLEGVTDPSPKDRAAVARQAYPWLERALDAGFTRAGVDLWKLYGSEAGEASQAQGRHVLEVCARRGDPAFQELLGRRMLAEDEQAAVEWLWRAAKGGGVTAWDCLGNLLLGGDAPDEREALDCFTKGAEGGDAEAQLDLAWLYFEGKHAPRDEARAAYWAGRAADVWEGAYPLLAHCLLHGIGMARDEDGALELLREALEYNLSAEDKPFLYPARDCRLLYRDTGEVCEKGLEEGVLLGKAAESYRLAAREFGDEESARRLARFRRGLFGRWRQIR